MKQFIKFLLICVMTHVAYGHGVGNNHESTIPKPLSVEIIDNIYILTKVTINNGDKTYRFIVDTGSTNSTVSRRIANELALPVIALDSATDGQTYQKFEVTRASLEIEGLTISEVRLDITNYDLNAGGQLCDVDGILGGNVLKNYAWSFRKGKVTALSKVDKKQLEVEGFSRYKMNIFSEVPLVMAGYRGTRSSSLLDLGFNGYLAVQESQLPYLWGKEIRKGRGQLIHTLFNEHEAPTESMILKMPEFDFGLPPKKRPAPPSETSIHNVIVDVENEQHYALNSLGAGLLNAYEMVLDYPKKRLYVKKIEGASGHSVLNTFGFHIDPESLKIVFVWNDSPAADLGLTPGDLVTQINGLDMSHQDFQSLPACERDELLSRELIAAEWVKVVVQNSQGQKIEGELRKTDLFATSN